MGKDHTKCEKCGEDARGLDNRARRRGVCCAACWKRSYVCEGCAATYVTCSEKCKERWREECRTMFLKPKKISGR